ncbi:MAG: hypothetical protein ACI4NM_10600 [Bullifex sp.]
MDSKGRYSDGVYTRKIEALSDPGLREKIARGIKRASLHKHEWASVDINDIVQKFAPGSFPEYQDEKLIFKSSDGSVAVVADVGGGYLRIQDLSKVTMKRRYLNLDGTDGHNYVDANGKIHGKSKEEYERTTHFRIKKRGEK